VIPRLLRFKDLKERRIAPNWTSLLRWIEHEGFPPGIRLAPNTRAWTEDEVAAWLASRPAGKRVA
jgi:predicted DNA-binding transcriptional regulator AlpA